MDIENLVRERVVGNIKTGKKNSKGIPEKLSYFNVEEDKATTADMVEIFRKLYPDKPTKLKIRFTNEKPFNFRFKRYVNGKAICIGNGTKAITVGKDKKGKTTQIEVACSEDCEYYQSGKCKLKGSIKFILDGINAGGVWNLSTSGTGSLSNIASELVKYKKANMSIVNVPFDLTLTEQESLAYGTYYSIDLHRTDIKPALVTDSEQKLIEANKKEQKQLPTSFENEDNKENDTENKVVKMENAKIENKQDEKIETQDEKYMTIKKYMPTMISDKKFNKIIFADSNNQEIEYILHPKASQDILSCGVGGVIEIIETQLEQNRNILCKYIIRKIKNPDGSMTDIDYENEELKKAV